MTLEMLEQYDDMCREAKMWEQELDELRKKNTVVKDTVRGSMSSFPYTTHSVTIQGMQKPNGRIAAQEKRLEERMERLDAMLTEIDDFIDKLEDSQLRQIINYRYVQGYSWVKTARIVGGKNTADGCRMKVARFFRKTG